MSTYSLKYTTSQKELGNQVSYSLVELPAALAKAADGRDLDDSLLATLTIKGQPTDEAVLCTCDTTYNVRSVKSSNSLLVCKPSTSTAVQEPNLASSLYAKAQSDNETKTTTSRKGKSVEVQTTLHQTLELEIAIPKLDRLSELLKDQHWSPDEANEGDRQSKVRILDTLREDFIIHERTISILSLPLCEICSVVKCGSTHWRTSKISYLQVRSK